MNGDFGGRIGSRIGGSFDDIQIMEEVMLELRGLAMERAAPVSDIVHEALGEYLLARANGINLFDIVRSIEKAIGSADRFVTSMYDAGFSEPAGLAIFIKSPIRYVYRPELKYEVRIARGGGASVGKLGVVLRSHDMDMLRHFSGFVGFWIELEQKYLPRSRAGQIAYVTDAGFFGRQICYPEAVARRDAQSIGDAISSYIRVFDELLKHYYNQRSGSPAGIENLYLTRLKDGKLTI